MPLNSFAVHLVSNKSISCATFQSIIVQSFDFNFWKFLENFSVSGCSNFGNTEFILEILDVPSLGELEILVGGVDSNGTRHEDSVSVLGYKAINFWSLSTLADEPLNNTSYPLEVNS